jgi:hypothetical protein
VSLLQRRLAIGYTRSSRLIDLMGIAGIIGEHKGSVAREVLISPRSGRRSRRWPRKVVSSEDEAAPDRPAAEIRTRSVGWKGASRREGTGAS